MGKMRDYHVKIDGVEFELDISYSYQQKRDGRSIVMQVERVTMLPSETDIDPEFFQTKMSGDLQAELETACDEYQEAREGTNWS